MEFFSGKSTESLLKFLQIFIIGLKSRSCLMQVVVIVSDARKQFHTLGGMSSRMVLFDS